MGSLRQKIKHSSINMLQQGYLISDSGKDLFVKQPNSNEVNVLQKAILENIKLVNYIFNTKLQLN